MKRNIGAAALILALAAALAAIWWPEYRWQSAATASLLAVVGASLTSTPDPGDDEFE